MSREFTGLTINHKFLPIIKLEEFCREEIAENKSPDWQFDIYRFILDFLNDSEVILQKTSGTTGESKIIELPKNSMIASAKNTIVFFQLKESDVSVLCLPIQYIAGKMMVVRAMVAGLNLILIEPSGSPDFWHIEKIDFCAMVPMQAANLLKGNKWPNLKRLILGGAEIGPELTRQLQLIDTDVYETFGMAETCSHVALKRINGKHQESFFTALPDIVLSTDERDCIVIEAPYLQSKITTNDRVGMVGKNHFNWLGRVDNIINSGGIKIQPEILERRIGEILQKNCVILGEPDELLGQKTVLIIESAEIEDSNQVLAKLAPFFDKKMLPKSVRFLKSLPRNTSFKIDRAALDRMI